MHEMVHKHIDKMAILAIVGYTVDDGKNVISTL